MGNKIVKAHLSDAVNLEYIAKGKVLRVFDTNGDGDLLPVVFKLDEHFSNQFSLCNQNYGTVFAEVA